MQKSALSAFILYNSNVSKWEKAYIRFKCLKIFNEFFMYCKVINFRWGFNFVIFVVE